MSRTQRVVGIKPPDEQWWKAMKAIYDNCLAAGVPVPMQVHDFFEGAPDEKGVIVDLERETTDIVGQPQEPIVTEYHGDMEEGWEIVVARIPKDIKVIRFYTEY